VAIYKILKVLGDSMLDILYAIAVVIFILMTFIIVRNYYSNKFDDKGRRKDMLDVYEDKD
jgi:TRAP-type C4-dicarboxylate transport system permease small subunit